MAQDASVTIDRTYFQTLLRKANVHMGYDCDQDVIVSRIHYESLEAIAREYDALKNTLVAGGVTVENLQLLINTGLGVQPPSNGHAALDGTVVDDVQHHVYEYPPPAGGMGEARQNSVVRDPIASAAVPIVKPPQPSPSAAAVQAARADVKINQKAVVGTHSKNYKQTPATQTDGHDDFEADNGCGYGNGHTGNGHNGYQHPSHKGRDPVKENLTGRVDFRKPSIGNRTLFLTRLSDTTTYASLLEAVRGGAIVDAWMKVNEHCASISFVDPGAAEAFYHHAKKNDLYISGRRIDVEWREPTRQFMILPNILRQITCNGATRVLQLRNIRANLSEAQLRDDLDHIANLDVVAIRFERALRTVTVALNSVCVACFARTCLKSRAAYKGVKIDFGPDECAGALPGVNRAVYVPKAPETRKETKANRFELLALGDGEGESSEDASDGEGLGEEDEDDLSTVDDSWADSTWYQNTRGHETSADEFVR